MTAKRRDRRVIHMEKKPLRSSGFSLAGRILAVLLIVAMMMSLTVSSQITFASLRGENRSEGYAAAVMEEYLEYLRRNGKEQETVIRRVVSTPKTYAEFLSCANDAIAREDYHKATEYLQGCIDTYEGDSDSDLALLYLRKGSLYILLGQPDTSMRELNRCIELDPKQADAYYLQLNLYLDNGDMESAAHTALRYEELARPDTETLAIFAQIYDSAEDYENAVRCYTAALEDEKTHNVKDLAARGRCRILLKDTEGAKKDLEDYFLEGGTDEGGEIAALLCGCYIETGDAELAVSAYESACENGLNPGGELRLYIALMYLSVENYARADEELNELAEQQPDNANARYYLGYSQFLQQKYSDAVSMFTEALRLGAPEGGCRYYRAVSMLQTDEPDVDQIRSDLETVCAKQEDEMLVKSAQEILALLEPDGHEHSHS